MDVTSKVRRKEINMGQFLRRFFSLQLGLAVKGCRTIRKHFLLKAVFSVVSQRLFLKTVASLQIIMRNNAYLMQTVVNI
jgi:hypothetical protein